MSTTDADRPDDDGFPSQPPQAPTGDEQLILEEWQKLSELALAEVDASAAKWKEGLLALATTSASGFLLLKGVGLESAEGMWFWIVLILWALASAVGLGGLWLGLAAAAGTPRRLGYEEFAQRYRSLFAFRRQQSKRVARQLLLARTTILVSISCTLLGGFLLQVAPTAGEPRLEVQTTAGTHCGTVRSADNGEIHLLVARRRDPLIIPLQEVTNLRPRSSC
ncbi:hypothetical protein [Tessaracoccus sp. OH4464_COT-324]|uniref:hypothetical protein n=1 Tax=Tessaracoccus sp. OH4464_COT-324 TaxID=2491059 RepID=UPI000F62F6C2|nr:hypothetical protein [Tessaracoccus sp. OH4464_COT-324]RRD45941.1 hypothetical protein EII42_09435 [Tessaracoccus sp. OH4464_COT-324]